MTLYPELAKYLMHLHLVKLSVYLALIGVTVLVSTVRWWRWKPNTIGILYSASRGGIVFAAFVIMLAAGWMAFDELDSYLLVRDAPEIATNQYLNAHPSSF